MERSEHKSEAELAPLLAFARKQRGSLEEEKL